MSGSQKPGTIPTYPDDAIQSAILPFAWWVQDDGYNFKVGRLVWAFLPHVDQLPFTIIPEGRCVPTEHRKFIGRIEPLDIKNPHKRTKLPVAGMPIFPKEIRAVYRAKKRPAVVVAEQGPAVPHNLTAGKPGWQTAPTLLVVPVYGGDEEGERAGFSQRFLNRIRKCEYPQFMLDWLPIRGSAGGSILRIDHIQPVGYHHNSLEPTEWRMSEEARMFFSEWIYWYFEGDMDANGLLAGWINQNA